MSNNLRRGMLLGLASKGITPSELGTYALEKGAELQGQYKEALFGLAELAGRGVSALAEVSPWLLTLPAAGAVGLGALTGNLGGTLGYKASPKDYEKADLDEIKKKQLEREMRLQVDALQRRIAQRGGKLSPMAREKPF